jgi:hypothetical protein
MRGVVGGVGRAAAAMAAAEDVANYAMEVRPEDAVLIDAGKRRVG